MTRYLIALIFFIGLSHISTAQATASRLPAIELGKHQSLEIVFTQNTRIDNLLVLVTDSAGKTLFLDNRYRFSGTYAQSFNLARAGKGKYQLIIFKDSEQSARDVIVK